MLAIPLAVVGKHVQRIIDCRTMLKSKRTRANRYRQCADEHTSGVRHVVSGGRDGHQTWNFIN
jgi:hypothetical protein